MSFSVGQVYECIEGGRNRQAIVLQTRGEGREGLLRYVDTRGEEWILGMNLSKLKSGIVLATASVRSTAVTAEALTQSGHGR